MSEIGLYKSIIEAISDAVMIVDREYRIVEFNSRMARRFNQPRDEVIGGKCYKESYRRDERCPDAECPVCDVLITKKPVVLEKPFHQPGGRVIWVEARGYPLLDDSDSISHIIVIGNEITKKIEDRERRENYLRGLEQSLEQMVQSKPGDESEFSDRSTADLTQRELEVLRLICEGFSNVEISKILSISQHTVKSHTTHIYNKIGVDDRTQAAVWATRNKLI